MVNAVETQRNQGREEKVGLNASMVHQLYVA
jgi:hypothetical protein